MRNKLTLYFEGHVVLFPVLSLLNVFVLTHLVISEDNAPLQYMWRHTELQQLHLSSLSCCENHPDRNQICFQIKVKVWEELEPKNSLHRVFVSKQSCSKQLLLLSVTSVGLLLAERGCRVHMPPQSHLTLLAKNKKNIVDI